jgi:hypothetical protein
MTCGGRNGALTLQGHCACLVCLSAESSLRTLPPTPQAPLRDPSGPACRGVGPGGGRSEFQAERRWRAASALAGSGVLGWGVATLRSPLLSQTGTNKHSPNPATPPKYLIFHAPRVIRTPDLLIRSRAIRGAVRDLSRTYAARCCGTAHEKSRISPQTGTQKAQPHSDRKFFLARTAHSREEMHAARCPGRIAPPLPPGGRSGWEVGAS